MYPYFSSFKAMSKRNTGKISKVISIGLLVGIHRRNHWNHCRNPVEIPEVISDKFLARIPVCVPVAIFGEIFGGITGKYKKYL